MKLETLITRYKNLGYEPKGLERDLEIASIIKWLYDKYDIYFYTQYNSMTRTKLFNAKHPELKLKAFAAHRIWSCSTKDANTFYSDKHFDNPYDALFDAVRETYKAIKFNFH